MKKESKADVVLGLNTHLYFPDAHGPDPNCAIVLSTTFLANASWSNSLKSVRIFTSNPFFVWPCSSVATALATTTA